MLRAAHDADEVTLSWSRARALASDEHFHLLKALDGPASPFLRVNPEGDASRVFTEIDPSAPLQLFDLRVADSCEDGSTREHPPGTCGALGRGTLDPSCLVSPPPRGILVIEDAADHAEAIDCPPGLEPPPVPPPGTQLVVAHWSDSGCKLCLEAGCVHDTGGTRRVDLIGGPEGDCEVIVRGAVWILLAEEAGGIEPRWIEDPCGGGLEACDGLGTGSVGGCLEWLDADRVLRTRSEYDDLFDCPPSPWETWPPVPVPGQRLLLVTRVQGGCEGCLVTTCLPGDEIRVRVDSGARGDCDAVWLAARWTLVPDDGRPVVFEPGTDDCFGD